MIKKVCAALIASVILVTTLHENVVGINATDLTEYRDEMMDVIRENNQDDIIPETSVIDTDDTLSLWNRLYSYALEYDETSEIEQLIDVSISADEDKNTVILAAVVDQNEIKLILDENMEIVQIVYLDESNDGHTEISTEQKISDIVGDVEFDNDTNLCDEVFLEYANQANTLLSDALLLWNNILASNGMSWGDFGFEYWESLCDLSKTSITENIEESDVDGLDEVIFDDESVESLEEDGDCTEDICVDEITVDEEEIVSDLAESEELNVQLADELLLEDEISAEEVFSEESLNQAVELPEVERVETDFDKLEINIGESIQLKAKYYPENADATIEWEINAVSSDDAACISLDSSNRLTANYVNTDELFLIAKAGLKEKRVQVFVKPNTLKHVTDEYGNPTVIKNDDNNDIVIAEGIWVGGFEKLGKIYTGSKVKQDIDVYYKGTKLTLNKDYSLTYKNNTKACDAYQINSPSVTITMKGQYSGKKTLFYEIKKASVSDVLIKTDGIALNYSGKEQKHVPTIYFNGKKLENKKDFTIEYDPEQKLSDLKGNGSSSTQIDYKIIGKGNFEGEVVGRYYITPKQCNISKATVSLKSTVKYNGMPIEEKDLNLKIKLPGEAAYSEVDPGIYEVAVVWPATMVGTGKVIITPKDDSLYSGTITKTFKIVAAYKLSDVAKVNESFDLTRTFYKNTEWNGQVGNCEGNRDQLLTLKEDGTKLTEGVDYKVKYSGISKVGTATATFTGIGAYSGTLVKKYKLIRNTTEPKIFVEESCPYVQGGVKAGVKVFIEEANPWGEYTIQTALTKNVDYSVAYSKNTKVGVASAKISFKGNYSNMATQVETFDIVPRDISQCKINVADKKYSTKSNSYKSVPTIYAPNGKKLVEGKDYSKKYEYIYNDMDITNSPSAGTTVMVKVTGINNYEGSFVTGTYKVYASAEYGMDKLFIAIDDQIYTGKAIKPDFENGIHIFKSSTDMKYKQNEIPNPGLRIISYKNNIKTGKASVVFGGTYSGESQYGGTKTVSFKIKKRDNNNVAVTGVYFDNEKETLFSRSTKAQKTLIARFRPEAPSNSTLIWKTSNPDVVSILEIDGQECTIQAQKNGSAIIYCTTQDGAKVAKCVITSEMKPFTGISLEQSTIFLNVGESTLEPVKTGFVPEDAYVEDVDLSLVSFRSSDESIAQIDSDGYITATGKGIATITAKLDGYSTTCVVAVETELVNVKDYGAKGDGVTDDTNRINSAINSVKWTGGNVYFPSGTYVVSTPTDGEAAINLNNAQNVNVYMDSQTVIYHGKDSSSNMRGVMCLDRASNVTINGGFINCDRAKQNVDEDYYGIMIVRSSDITVSGTKVANSKGDGIYIGKDVLSGINKNINISHCTIDGCRRNNISLVNVDTVTIEECNINNARGYYLPGVSYAVGGTGIDVEPNQNQYAMNIDISRCIFKGNRSDFGIHCHYKKVCSYTHDITLDGCSFDKLVYIQCGKNVEFKNTVTKPKNYCDDRVGEITRFPD